MRRVLTFILLCAPLVLCSCKKAGPEGPPSALQKQKAPDAASAPFVAGKRSKVYHERHCQYAQNLEAPIGFATLRDAEASGKFPCEFCRPHMTESAPTASEKPAAKP